MGQDNRHYYLFKNDGMEGRLTKLIDALHGSDPDASLPVFQATEDEVGCQTFTTGERVGMRGIYLVHGLESC
jgi:hypothetical protein